MASHDAVDIAVSDPVVVIVVVRRGIDSVGAVGHILVEIVGAVIY